MKITSWNVNSLKARLPNVELYLEREAPDVLCLQELKQSDEAVPREVFEARGYHLAVHGQPQYNGVLIASRAPLTDVRIGLPGGDEGQARLVSAVVDGVRLVNVYCPQGQAADSPKFQYKLSFFDALLGWLERHCAPEEPLALLGDLNIARHPEDLWDPAAFVGVPTFHPEEHRRWDALLAWGLQDAVRPHIAPGTFSFWDYRGAAFRFGHGMRIDHFLVTAPLMPRVRGAEIQRPWRKKVGDLTASDHAPVVLDLQESA